jgi:hypothetical protein
VRRATRSRGVSVGRTLAHGEAIKMSSLSGPGEKRFKLAKAQFAETGADPFAHANGHDFCRKYAKKKAARRKSFCCNGCFQLFVHLWIRSLNKKIDQTCPISATVQAHSRYATA